jgi:hypothetical protein
MAHFSKIDENNKVVQVVVVSNEITTPDGVNESEQLGIDFLYSQYGGGVWKQTSYNNNIRKRFTGIGYDYNEGDDVFISPKPYPSWSLDASHDWQPPIPKPEGDYFWKESNQSWAVAE